MAVSTIFSNPTATARSGVSSIFSGEGGLAQPGEDEPSGNIFTNAFRDLKDMVGGIATIAGTVGSDIIQAGQDVVTLGKAEGDYNSDDIVNAVTGGMLNAFGEGWHPSESVLVQDYANRYGSLEKFGHGLIEHPLSFLSDALMVVTLGGSGASTAAGILSKTGKVGEAASAVASSLGKVATVADEVRFLNAGKLGAEELGTAAKFVRAVQGEAFKYVDPITGKLGYFDPIRNPIKRAMVEKFVYPRLLEKGGAGLKGAEALASEALNGGAAATDVFDHAMRVQRLLDYSMKEGAPVMKRWAATYKAKRYIDFMYGSSKLKKTAILRDVDKATAEVLKDLPDGISDIDVMNASMGLDGSLVNDGYSPKSGLRRSEVFGAVGPETSSGGATPPGLSFSETSMPAAVEVPAVRQYLPRSMSETDVSEVAANMSDPAYVYQLTNKTSLQTGVSAKGIEARPPGRLPAWEDGTTGPRAYFADTGDDALKLAPDTDNAAVIMRVKRDAVSDLQPGTFKGENFSSSNVGVENIEVWNGTEWVPAGSSAPTPPPAAADMLDTPADQLLPYLDETQVEVNPNGHVVVEVDPTTGEARIAEGAETLRNAVRAGEDVKTALRKATKTADVERPLQDAHDFIDSKQLTFTNERGENVGMYEAPPLSNQSWADETKLLNKAKTDGRATDLGDGVWRYSITSAATDEFPSTEVRVYVATDKSGKVISTREVDSEGRVNAATASDVQGKGAGTKLINAHWADEGVTDLEGIKRVIGKNTLSAGGVALNKRAARKVLRGVDSPGTAPSSTGKVLSAELRTILSGGKPITDDVIADIAGDLRGEFGPGVVDVGSIKNQREAAAKAALAGGMDAVTDAGPRFRIVRADMNTDAGLREAVNKAGDAMGGTLRRVENQVHSPGADGSRVLTAVFDTDHGPVEVQFLTPLARETMDATSNLRAHLSGLTRQLSRETDHGARLELARRIKIAEAYSQNLWEGVTAEMRQALGGHTDSVMRQKLNRLRMELHKNMGDAAIEAGLPVESLFENPYLAQRMMNGATWDTVTEDFIGGGQSALDLDAMNAQQGRMAPVYMPAIDARRLPTRGQFMMKNTGSSGLRIMEDANLRKNTGYLLEKSLDKGTGKLKTKGGLISTDLRRAMAVRARRAANSQVSHAMVKATLDQYSRKVVDWTEKADDEVMWSPMLLNFVGNTRKGSDDVLMHALENGLNDGEELANWLERTTIKNQEYLRKLMADGGDMELRAVPKVVADRLEDYTKTIGGENLRVLWRNPTQMWKTLVLSGSPRWVMNNIVGNTIFLKLQGGKMSDVIRQLDGRWLRHIRKAVGMKEENAFKAALRDVMPDEIRTRVEGAGLYDAEFRKTTTQYTDDTMAGRMAKRMQQSTLNENPALRLGRTWSDFTHRLNEGIEEAYRRASYLRASDKVAMRAGVLGVGHKFWTTKENLQAAFRNGFDEKTAAGLVDEVNHFLNDYNKMTPAGQNIIRPYLMPFWGFYRHATRMLLTMPFEHPGKAQLLRAFNSAAEDQRDELGLLPSWLENALPLGPGPAGSGDYRFLSTAGMNPFNTVLESPLNLLHPYAKMLYEQSTGRSTFTGKQFTDPNVYKAFGSEQQYRMVNGQPVPIDKVTPGLLQEVLSQIPQYTMVSDILAGGSTYDTADIVDILRGQGTVIDPETGQPVYPKGVMETLAKMMGYSTTTFNPAEFTEKRLSEMEAVLKLAETRNPTATAESGISSIFA